MKLRIIYENDEEDTPEDIARYRRDAINTYAGSYSEMLGRTGKIDPNDMDAGNAAYDQAKADAATGSKSHLTNRQLFDLVEKLELMGRTAPTQEAIGPYIIHGDHTGRYSIQKDGQEVGYVLLTDGGGTETVTARENFPGIVGPKERCGRLHAIEVSPRAQGAGLGKWLMLKAMANMKTEWVFNSQLSMDATMLMIKLQRAGWIDLHWKRNIGDLFVARITPAGRQALESHAFLKQ